MKISAIVLAAGSGSRMQSSKKKQFMEIKGKPLVWYSLFAFEKYGVDEIILVTGLEDIDFCKKEIVEKYNFTKVKDIVAGGKERYESVYNGLKHISGDIVLIHDGARPVLTNEIIERGINGAIKDKKLLLSLHPAVISLKNSFFNYSLYYFHLYNLYSKSVSIITFLPNLFSLQ